MVENWKIEIFNYFDYHYTNAAIESLNNLASAMEAAGKGYSYHVLRTKILFGTKARKPAKYSYYPDKLTDGTDANGMAVGIPGDPRSPTGASSDTSARGVPGHAARDAGQAARAAAVPHAAYPERVYDPVTGAAKLGARSMGINPQGIGFFAGIPKA